jgi:hypothetical protein
MADMDTALRSEGGVAFLVSAGIVYEIIAAACSSPQTTEINAATRAGTLMKWVHIGIGQAALFIAIAAYIDPRHRTAIIGGGAAAGGLMYLQYVHARRAGLASAGPGTEGAQGASAARGIGWAA